MSTSAITRVLGSPKHSEIAEQILLYLAWSDLLHASAVSKHIPLAPADLQVCTHLNDVVTSSSRLQLTLRAAYHDVEQCTKHGENGPGAQLRRLVDVQRRWATLDPKRVELVRLPSGAMQISGGLLVMVHEDLNHVSPGEDENSATTAEEDAASSTSMDYYAPHRAWTVYDHTNVRESPVETAPTWTHSPGYKFASFAISREENVIAVARIPVLDGDTCEVFFYMLEPTDHGDSTPVQHPQAVAAGYLTVPVSCTDWIGLALAPGVVYVTSCFTGNAWNWRTGEQTMASFDMLSELTAVGTERE